MAEAQPKRPREETHDAEESQECGDSNSQPKRQKPYHSILSLLDDEQVEEEEPCQDLSAMFKTLQQELSSAPISTFDFDFLPVAEAEEAQRQQITTHPSTSAACSSPSSGENEGVNSVIRHLLEASDDELGIPNTEDNCVDLSSAENFPFGPIDDGLWELEDVAANYYTVLQSELFM